MTSTCKCAIGVVPSIGASKGIFLCRTTNDLVKPDCSFVDQFGDVPPALACREDVFRKTMRCDLEFGGDMPQRLTLDQHSTHHLHSRRKADRAVPISVSDVRRTFGTFGAELSKLPPVVVAAKTTRTILAKVELRDPVFIIDFQLSHRLIVIVRANKSTGEDKIEACNTETLVEGLKNAHATATVIGININSF